MFSSAKNTIEKVPATEMEALKSSLMGLFEKKRMANFYKAMDAVDLNNKMSWKDFDYDKNDCTTLFKKYNLEANTIDFLGHAVALERDDAYLKRPARETAVKM